MFFGGSDFFKVFLTILSSKVNFHENNLLGKYLTGYDSKISAHLAYRYITFGIQLPGETCGQYSSSIPFTFIFVIHFQYTTVWSVYIKMIRYLYLKTDTSVQCRVYMTGVMCQEYVNDRLKDLFFSMYYFGTKYHYDVNRLVWDVARSNLGQFYSKQTN